MTAMRLHRYPSPSGGIALGKMGVEAKMMRDSILPPGARWVEYLESTGTQWIDTGVVPDINTYVALNVMYTALDTTFRTPLSVRESDGALNSFTIAATSASSNVFAFGRTYWTIGVPSLNIKYSASLRGGRATFGEQIGNPGVSITPNGQTAFLFARNSNGTASNFLIGRIYNVDVHNGNQRLHDFRPIAIGTTGYMLDLISGNYLQYGNAGAGNFVIGPDAPPPTI